MDLQNAGLHQSEKARQVLDRYCFIIAHADQLEAEVRDATCCVATDRCWSCEVTLGEVRAIRRDALLHSISTVRPRRAVR